MKTAVIFDLDGTLLNTLEDLTDAVNATLQQFGCPSRTIDEVRAFVGTGARNLIRKALPGNPDNPSVDEVLAAYQVYYSAHSQIKTGPYDGVLAAIREIRAQYPVAIVSNKPDGATKDLCAMYFPGVYARGESSDCPRKPAPDMVFRAMNEIGADACIYVGDSETDVETARNAGAKCLSVLWGFRDKACLEEAGAEYFCENPADLLQKIEEMM